MTATRVERQNLRPQKATDLPPMVAVSASGHLLSVRNGSFLLFIYAEQVITRP
jgi:hypothetical protein